MRRAAILSDVFPAPGRSSPSAAQIGKTITVSPDNPVPLHLNLGGASQLAIDCAATHSATDAPVAMDIAFGNAVLASS